MIEPSYEDFEGLASKANIVPVFKEILADTETPVSAYLKIRHHSKYSFLLESVEGGEKIARYSFLGVGPFKIFRSRGKRVVIEDQSSGMREEYRADPIKELRKLVEGHRGVHLRGLPRFTGGAVGYVAYDGVRLVEDIPDDNIDDLNLDDIVFLFFDSILAFDNIAHKIILISNVRVDSEGDLRDKYDAAIKVIAKLENALSKSVDGVPRAGKGHCEVVSNLKKEDYKDRVLRCKEYILAGDIVQVVISQRFQTEISVDPFEIYRMLRIVNPSPYMFHISMDGLAIVGASPELLVRVEDGIVTTRPIAGTRKRGENEEEDRKLERELLSDEKELAEHLMLLDLGRNDIGRVSRYSSVEVTEQMRVERYSHVMHIVSNVKGKLRDGFDELDALFACFPAGTLTGAPKIRAMEIIDEMEPTRRGVYGGAVGYLDFSGNLDTCISIRTLVAKDGNAYIQAGGGIVADSMPENEFAETVNKAKALIKAIQMAERGDITVDSGL